MIALVILLLALLLPVIWVIVQYNWLVSLRNYISESWSNVDTELKRRYDLIPNLVATVKGYAAHERGTLDAVVKARQQAIAASGNVAEAVKAENALSQTLRSLFAVAEAYPDLKANQNFLALQEELASTENKIGFARQYYNDSAMRFKNRVEVFPSNIFANMFGFAPEPFFQVETEAEKQPPQVKFP